MQFADQQHRIDPHHRLRILLARERLHKCEDGLAGVVGGFFVGDIGKQKFPHPLAHPLDRGAVRVERQLWERDVLQESPRGSIECPATAHGLFVGAGFGRRLDLRPVREAGVVGLTDGDRGSRRQHARRGYGRQP